MEYPDITILLFVVPEPAVTGAGFTVETRVYKKVGDRELRLSIEKPSAWKPIDQRPAVVGLLGCALAGSAAAASLPSVAVILSL